AVNHFDLEWPVVGIPLWLLAGDDNLGGGNATVHTAAGKFSSAAAGLAFGLFLYVNPVAVAMLPDGQFVGQRCRWRARDGDQLGPDAVGTHRCRSQGCYSVLVQVRGDNYSGIGVTKII